MESSVIFVTPIVPFFSAVEEDWYENNVDWASKTPIENVVASVGILPYGVRPPLWLGLSSVAVRLLSAAWKVVASHRDDGASKTGPRRGQGWKADTVVDEAASKATTLMDSMV